METYLTIPELAAHIKLSEQTVRRYVLRKEIPCHRVKRAVRFRLSEIEAWITNGGNRADAVGVSPGELFEAAGLTGEGEGNKQNDGY
jgi:excisionase family DNA binding protein